MNKRLIERIGMAAVIAFVAYFCYQVAYGTNESSYQYGFKDAVVMYSNCAIREEVGGNCIEYGIALPMSECNVGTYHIPVQGIVTNQTACVDGYIDGWKHWCNSDAKICASYATVGQIQGIIFNATTSIQLANWALHFSDTNYTKSTSAG